MTRLTWWHTSPRRIHCRPAELGVHGGAQRSLPRVRRFTAHALPSRLMVFWACFCPAGWWGRTRSRRDWISALLRDSPVVIGPSPGRICTALRCLLRTGFIETHKCALPNLASLAKLGTRWLHCLRSDRLSGAGEWPRSPRLHPLESNLPLQRHYPCQSPSPALWEAR